MVLFYGTSFGIHNAPRDFFNLSLEERERLMNWIKENLKPIKTMNRNHTSYGLKHYAEHDFVKNDEPFYISNGMFKGAMIQCGFKSNNMNQLNWYFGVSEKSIALLKRRGLRAC